MSQAHDAALHQRACEVMAEAVALPEEQRADFVARECGANDELRARVEKLLDHHRRAVPLQPLIDSSEVMVGAKDAAGDRPSPSIPDCIGPFRIVRELGRGSHGIVYEAQQEQPRRRIALKVLQPGWLAASQAGRFEREAAALARFNHPAIAAIYEAGRSETSGGLLPWFAMELVEGQPLDDWVATRELSRRARVELLAQIAAAVHHAHEHGVIHRDLKPANVLVRRDGQVKVVDFGVAALLDPDTATLEQMTASGAFVGTLAYVSPEQTSGESARADARCDIYSLGVIAYELLVGRLPYDTRECTLSAALRLILEFEPVTLRRIDPSVPHDLENIVRKAMEKEPARRYDSAAALANDLENWLAERPVAARAPSAFYVAAKFARRHRGFVAGLVIALLALIGGFIMLSIGLKRATDALQVSETRRVGALELISRLIQTIHEVKELSGGRSVVKKVIPFVRQMVEQYDLRPSVAEQDPRVLSPWADLLAAEGDLLQSDGQRDGAERNFRDVLGVRRQLSAMPTSDVALTVARARALSVAQVRIGDVAKDGGEYDAAARWYSPALQIDEALVAEHPATIGCLDDLCYSYERHADLAQLRGDPTAAIAWADKHIGAVERLVELCDKALDPARAMEARFHLARALFGRIDFGPVGTQRETLMRAHRQASELAANPQADRRTRLLEIATCFPLAQLEGGDGNRDRELALLTYASEQSRRLEAEHPGDVEVWVRRWRAESGVAGVLSSLGQVADAVTRFDAVIAAFEARRRRLPEASLERDELEESLVAIRAQSLHAIDTLPDDERLRSAIRETLLLADQLVARRPTREAAAFEALFLCFYDGSIRMGFFENGLERLDVYFDAYDARRRDFVGLILGMLHTHHHDDEAARVVAFLRAKRPDWPPSIEAALRVVEERERARGR